MTTPPIVPAPPPVAAQPAASKPPGVPRPRQAPLVAGPQRPLPLAPVSAAAATSTGFTSLATALAAGPVAGAAVLGTVALGGAGLAVARRRMRVDPMQRLGLARARWQARRQRSATRRQESAERVKARGAAALPRRPGASTAGTGPGGSPGRTGGRLGRLFRPGGGRAAGAGAGRSRGPAAAGGGSPGPPGRLTRAGSRARGLLPGAKGRAARAAARDNRAATAGTDNGGSRWRNPFRRSSGDAGGGPRLSKAERKAAKKTQKAQRKTDTDSAGTGTPAGRPGRWWKPSSWRRTPPAGPAAPAGKASKAKSKKKGERGKDTGGKPPGTEPPGGGVTGKPPRRQGTSDTGKGPAVWSSKPRKRTARRPPAAPGRWWDRKWGRSGTVTPHRTKPPPKPPRGGVGPVPKPKPGGPYPSDTRQAARKVVPHPDQPSRSRRQDLADSQWPDLVSRAVTRAAHAPQATRDRWQQRTERSTGMTNSNGGGSGDIQDMRADMPRYEAQAGESAANLAADFRRRAAEVADGSPSSQAVKDAWQQIAAQQTAVAQAAAELAGMSQRADAAGHQAADLYAQDPNARKWFGQ